MIVDMEDILLELDTDYPNGDDTDIVEIPLGRIRAILNTGECYRKELYQRNVMGMPRFAVGDYVRDLYLNKTFMVQSAHVSQNGDEGYCWFYQRGGYFIPETDLELVKPRSSI